MTRNWFPLESNPEVMTAYMERLGMNTAQYSFCDVLSTEDWALDMVPRPVLAVLMLFPITEVEEEHRHQEAQRIAAEGQTVSSSVYFTKQTISNACGTIGLLHAAGNGRLAAPDLVVADSHLDVLLRETATLDSDEVAARLEADDALEEAHAASATEGQSALSETDVDTHFIAFVHVDGGLYELDGRKDSPIRHRDTTQETLLEDAIEVVKGFMARQPTETRFTLLALASLSA